MTISPDTLGPCATDLVASFLHFFSTLTLFLYAAITYLSTFFSHTFNLLFYLLAQISCQWLFTLYFLHNSTLFYNFCQSAKNSPLFCLRAQINSDNKFRLLLIVVTVQKKVFLCVFFTINCCVKFLFRKCSFFVSKTKITKVKNIINDCLNNKGVFLKILFNMFYFNL